MAFRPTHRTDRASSPCSTQRRILAEHSKTAHERYTDFLCEHPEIVERVPLRHIASYLGITPEALSRIRKQLANKESA
jgi:CRP-like cAMP-binding protein